MQRDEALSSSGSARHGAGPLAPPAVSQRLSLYLRRLQALRDDDCATVSSSQLARDLGLSAAQVRKDLTYFGQFGLPGVGYRVDPLIEQIQRILGTDRARRVAIVGVGHLGKALVRYKGFTRQGFEVVAMFDADPKLHGRRYGGVEVHPMERLDDLAAELRIEIAILAVPASVAQQVADRIVAAGIRGILNFAPRTVSVPPSVGLAAVDLSIQLEQITHQLRAAGDDASREQSCSAEAPPSDDPKRRGAPARPRRRSARPPTRR